MNGWVFGWLVLLLIVTATALSRTDTLEGLSLASRKLA